ncbi:hypothetical protein ACTZWW_11220 [Salinarimonas sp. NSM]
MTVVSLEAEPGRPAGFYIVAGDAIVGGPYATYAEADAALKEMVGPTPGR